MKTHTARFVNCIGCNCQFYICSDCDHGNIYCGPICAANARKKFTKLASQRYQNTFNGKRHHAVRQKRYRARNNKIVTHQGSQTSSICVSLPILINLATKHDTNKELKKHYCHFCGKCCSEFVRQDYFRQKPTARKANLKSLPQAP